MSIAFQLRRRSAAEPTAALLLPSTDPRRLLDLCSRLQPWPRLHALAGGFLVELTQPGPAGITGAIRLRALCDHIYLPADADLVPPLFDDELRGLVRDRGLVFLPGGRVLGYDRHRPLPLAKLMETGPVLRRGWQPLPEPPYLAPRLETIAFDLPPPDVDHIIATGGEDIGSESPRPQAGGFMDRLAGKTQASIGKGLLGLGNLMGWKGLAKYGAGLVAGAVQMVPALSESILGKQEAALRELLRWFRDGKIDEALKRALPLGGAGDRGGTPATGWQLPWHQLRYNLSNLLGGGSGPASVWFGGYDVQAELAKEYRRAADQALQQGDHRRAAFIYGRLLQDYRRAADVLFQGGLFRDAALIYLHKLDDRKAAARAFESAGDIDKAVELYRLEKLHVAAGDVLRRAGEEEQARAEYRIAAELLIHSGDHLSAGELVLAKTDDVEWAESIFTTGWQRRPDANATACVLRLARLHADREALDRLMAVAREARTFYDSPGNEVPADEFHNSLARLADRPTLEDVKEELRDLARVGLAIKVRQRALVESKPGEIVARLLGRSGAWPAAVVSDAAHAVRELSKRTPELAPPRPATRLRLGVGTVTAVCSAPLTGEVFLAFDYGKIACFRPAGTELVVIRERWDHCRIDSLAVDAKGEVLLSSQFPSPEDGYLSRYVKRPNGQYHMETSVALEGNQDLVSPLIVKFENHLLAALSSAEKPALWDVNTLTPVSDLIVGEWAPDNDGAWHWCNASAMLTFPCRPFFKDGSCYELAAVNQGVLRWSRKSFSPGLPNEQKSRVSVSPHGYRTCAIVRPGLLAGVTEVGIDWLRTSGQYLTTMSTTPASFDEPIAAFHSPLTGEVLVICKDGVLERVTVPAG